MSRFIFQIRALALCSETIQASEKGMADKENFRIYRILQKGDVDNGVFGTDEVVLCEKDCEPYINLKPFPVCQSSHYVEAMGDLQQYWYSKISEYRGDSDKQEQIRSQYELIGSSLEAAREKEGIIRGNRSLRNYQCVLQLLDHWFNASNEVFINSFEDQKNKTMEAIALKGQEMREYGDAFIEKVRNKIPESYRKTFPSPTIGDDTPNRTNTIEVPGRSGGGEAKTSDDNYQGILNSIDEKQLEDWEQDRQDSINLDSIMSTIYDRDSFEREIEEGLAGLTYRTSGELYFDDDIGGLSDGLEEVRRNAGNYQKQVEEMVKLAGDYGLQEEANQWNQYVGSIIGELSNIKNEITDMKNSLDSQAVVTKASYLVCRCGGIIRIVDDGQWVEGVDLKIQKNFVKVLLKIEGKLWENFQGKPKGKAPDFPSYGNDYVATRYSLILAINMVQDLLASLDSAGKYTDKLKNSYKEEYEQVILRYPIPKVIIELTPQNELEKDESREAIVRELVDMLPFGINWIFRALFFAQDMSNSYTPIEETDKIKKVAGYALEEGAKLAIKEGRGMVKGKLGEGLGTVEDTYNSPAVKGAVATAKWYQLLEAAMTQSYALYIGQIDIKIHTGWDEYKYRAKFDGEGKATGTVEGKISFVGANEYAAYDNYNYAINGVGLGDKIEFGIYKEE